MFFKKRKRKRFLEELKTPTKDYTVQDLIDANFDLDEKKAEEVLEYLVQKRIKQIQ